MIALDEPITFTIEGDDYEYQSWVNGQGYVAQKGKFGPEYGGSFVLRYGSFDDQSAVYNQLRARFPLGTQDIRARHVDAVLAVLTILQVKTAVPKWFAMDRLGDELDEAAVIAVYEKHRAEKEARKKVSAAT